MSNKSKQKIRNGKAISEKSKKNTYVVIGQTGKDGFALIWVNSDPRECVEIYRQKCGMIDTYWNQYNKEIPIKIIQSSSFLFLQAGQLTGTIRKDTKVLFDGNLHEYLNKTLKPCHK